MILRAVRTGWSLLVGAAIGFARAHPSRLRRLDFGPFHEALEASVGGRLREQQGQEHRDPDGDGKTERERSRHAGA